MVDLNPEEREPAKLIALDEAGKEVARPFGVTIADTYNLDTYLAIVIANSLRLLAATTNTARDLSELELIAGKLEFYGNEPESAVRDNIDFSKDVGRDLEDPNWLSFHGAPGFEEYCHKSQIVDKIQQVYIREALDWLKDNWSSLWD